MCNINFICLYCISHRECFNKIKHTYFRKTNIKIYLYDCRHGSRFFKENQVRRLTYESY